MGLRVAIRNWFLRPSRREPSGDPVAVKNAGALVFGHVLRDMNLELTEQGRSAPEISPVAEGRLHGSTSTEPGDRSRVLVSGAGVVLGIAQRAVGIDDSVRSELLQHTLEPLVVARLTNVVLGLRSDWVAGCAQRWDDVRLVGEDTRADFDKRVAAALREGFFQFSQFLAGFEVVVLKLQELGVVCEQTLLGLEEKTVQIGDLRRALIEVADLEQRAANVLRALERTGCAHDE